MAPQAEQLRPHPAADPAAAQLLVRPVRLLLPERGLAGPAPAEARPRQLQDQPTRRLGRRPVREAAGASGDAVRPLHDQLQVPVLREVSGRGDRARGGASWRERFAEDALFAAVRSGGEGEPHAAGHD